MNALLVALLVVFGRLLGSSDAFQARTNRRGPIAAAICQQDEQVPLQTDDRDRLLASAAICSLVAVAALLPLPALAIDHPADYAFLGIPLPIPDYRYFLSGGLCAAASHGITTPIDVVKTRIQSEPLVFDKGLAAAATAILQEDGAGALLGGLGPTVIGYGLEGAAKFGLYESLKPVMSDFFRAPNPTLPYLAAAVLAGAVASLMLCPMERTRIRLVTDPTFATGLLDGLPKLVQQEGPEYLFEGMPAMLSKQIPYTITKQVTFDVFAGILYSVAAGLSWQAADVKYQVAILAAFLASILSCITSHPGDVILTATYKSPKRIEFGEVVSSIYETQGLKGFVTGISARFLHVGAIITSQLVLYDTVKQLLGLPATGAH